MNPQQTPTTGFLREKQLREYGFAPFARSTLWRKVKNGTYPAPVKLSPRITAWRVESILAWAAEQSA